MPLELFRSEPMQYCRLTITNDAAQDTIRELGNMGKFHIVDLNATAAVPSDAFMYYKKRVVQCVFWDRKLKRFEEEMEKNGVELPPFDVPVVETKVADLMSAIKGYVEPLEADLGRNLEFKSVETRRMNELYERALVLEVCKSQLFGADALNARDLKSDLRQPFLQGEAVESPIPEEKKADTTKDLESGFSRFHDYICGVIPFSQQAVFERMLFRLTRGNSLVKFQHIEDEIPDPATGEKMKKVVFYVVYVGQQMARRIEKMCDFLRATRYQIPTTPEQFERELGSITLQINEKRQVLERTQDQVVALLNRIAWEGGNRALSPLRNWQDALKKEKSICDALKQCQTPNSSAITVCEGWIPVEEIDNLKVAVAEATRHSGAQPVIVQLLERKKTNAPPTYFKLNKFTANFQGIVDTYGVPRYQEVNPGLFTIVTFPFLFGVMYGDVGHGLFLFAAAAYMVLKEDDLNKQARAKKLNEIASMMFNGRYLILCMAICGVYCGTVYNDVLSVPTNVFGSSWSFVPGDYENGGTNDGTVYPYGMDPGWYNTKNELTFFNSLKMKLSVTYGVVQMTFGIVLSAFNHIYFSDHLGLYFEFIPQLLFMLCTFGYMIFLIFFKFCVDWEALALSGSKRVAPNLIQTMINMFLKPGSIAEEEVLYSGQGVIQVILVLVAVFSVPVMLLAKPLIERRHHLAKHPPAPQGPHFADHSDNDADIEHRAHSDEFLVGSGSSSAVASQSGAAAAAGGHGHGDEEEVYNFSEHFIHQCIHTIEFVLGCVSNTASYLRLWALSLAHAELAHVFWQKLIMQYGVLSGSPIMTFIAFGAWFGATAAVLLAMDVLECFLHALRLHWVEFQNKFYRADGYAFKPFNFEEKEED